jgi:hypothetical protein
MKLLLLQKVLQTITQIASAVPRIMLNILNAPTTSLVKSRDTTQLMMTTLRKLTHIGTKYVFIFLKGKGTQNVVIV